MRLSEILLAVIDEDEFSNKHSFWYPKWNNHRSAKYYTKLGILEPFVFRDYREVIDDFIKSEFCSSISLVNREDLERYFIDDLSDGKIDYIDRIANQDRLRRGNFELHFKCRRDSKHHADLKFVDIGGAVYSYEINFPVNLASLFTWKRGFNFDRWKFKGLWLPNDW